MDDREPGPSSAGGRLPSFKSPRDLSLSTGAVQMPRSRRNYVPNIPPKRDRNIGGTTTASSTVGPSTSSRGRPHQTSAKPNYRERKQFELVQSTSIFGEGIGSPHLKPRRSSGAVQSRSRATGSSGGERSEGREGSQSQSRSRSKNSTEVRTHGPDDDEDIDYDGFIADLDEEIVPEELVPISLPLSDCINYLYTSDSDEEGKTSKSEFEPVRKLNAKTSFDELMKESPDGTLILMQFPEQLPFGDQTSSDSQATGTKLSNNIGTLPEGPIGKIQILASGRARFVLGENNFDVEAGKLVGFRQELASIDEELKKMTLLGHVQYKFNCTPDIESLFQDNVM